MVIGWDLAFISPNISKHFYIVGLVEVTFVCSFVFVRLFVFSRFQWAHTLAQKAILGVWP